MLLSGIQNRASYMPLVDAVHVLDPRLEHAGMTEEVTSQRALAMTLLPEATAGLKNHL
jgi:hypothetical protein